jgi:hypothetical protein
MLVALAGLVVIYYYKYIDIQFLYIYWGKNPKIKKSKHVTSERSRNQ